MWLSRVNMILKKLFPLEYCSWAYYMEKVFRFLENHWRAEYKSG